jgi:hypothetical protein
MTQDPFQPDNTFVRRFSDMLTDIWKLADTLGKSLMGELWTMVYLAIQDAIALSILAKCAQRAKKVKVRLKPLLAMLLG